MQIKRRISGRKISLFIVLIFVLIVAVGFQQIVSASAESLPNNAIAFTGRAALLPEEKHEQTKLVSYSDEIPALTILTHGQGGDATTWANDIIANNGVFSNKHGGEDVLVYDSNSIIENLRRAAGGGGVFWAKVNEANDNSGNKYFSLLRCLIPANAQELDRYIYEPVQFLSYPDTQMHNIIIFDSTDRAKSDSHEIVYSELDLVIDNLLYDYKLLTNNVPKINLIAHSRGGITNAMYASRHPYNVDSLFSMGTPYHGSNLAAIAAVSGLPIGGAVDNNSGRDILNPIMMDLLKDEWNAAYAINNNMNAYALGGAASFDFISQIIKGNYVSDYGVEKLYLDIAAVAIDLFNACPNVFKTFYGLETIVYEICNYFNFQFLPDGLTFRDIQNVVEEIKEVSKSYKFLSDVEVERIVETEKQFVFCDDIFIDLHSQLAPGYNGFNRAVKVFTKDNAIMDAVTLQAPPAVHNLEARDKDNIRYILSKIRLNDNNFRYNTEMNADGTVTLSSINFGNFNGNSISIPSVLSGKTVTGIGANLFARNYWGFDTTSITSIIIPTTVTSISENAFYGCGISAIEIPRDVNNIAVGAFSNCQNLVSINVHAENINYKSVNGVLYSKDKTKLVQYPAAKTDTSFTLDSATQIIDTRSFEGQKNIQSVYLANAIKIMDFAFYGADSLTNVNNGNSIIFVGKDAFEGTKWLEQDIRTDVILGKVYIKYKEAATNQSIVIPDNILHIAGGAFEDSTIISVALPSSLTSIGCFAFYNCDGLRKITIPRNVVEIGEYAFANSSQINEINMLTLYPPRLGYGAFNNEAASRKIYLPSLVKESYKQKIDWATYASCFDVKQISITFDTNGAPAYLGSIVIDYYSYITNLPALLKDYRPYYLFRGWYLNDNQYLNGSILDEFAETIVLKAKWDPITYRIGYIIKNGTNNTLNPLEYTIESNNILYAPTMQAGYVFEGWYLSANYSGEKVTRLEPGTNGNIVLYAKTTAIKYTVYFDVNDSEAHPGYVNPTSKTNIEFNQANSLPMPNREGHTFLGWYTQRIGGVQYTNGEGEATRPWDIASDTVLYAHWEANIYYIRIDFDGSIVWLGADGDLSSVKIPLTYGQSFVCPHALALELVNAGSMKDGHRFLYFLAPNGEPLHIAYYTVPNYGASGSTYAITAKWEKEIHSIYFDSQGGSSVSNIVNVAYDEIINLPTPTKTGYTFIGWVVKDEIPGYPKNTIFNYYRMPDLTVLTQQNGSIGLVAVWENESYVIYFDSMGGSNVSPKTVVYLLTPTDYSVPYRKGYNFEGWYDSRDYIKQYASSTGVSTRSWDKAYSADLYAKWTVIPYSIAYDLNGGTNHLLNVGTYNIEQTVNLYYPTKDGYEFVGWYDADNNVYCTHISINSIGNRSFVAIWFADEFVISSVGGTHTYNTRIVVVDLSNADLNKSFNFIVGTSVQEITFKSTNYSSTPINMAITCNYRYNSITIRFININMAPTANDVSAVTVNGYNIGLYLFYSGINSIVGGSGSSKYGLNEVGNPGGAGIFAQNNYVYLSGTGSLSITGGQGGASGRGQDGQKGENGKDAGIIIAHGGEGHAGYAGLMGQNGARGGYGIDAAYVGIQDTAQNLKITGGKGGTGGQGGKGGDGGRGGHGGGSVLIAMNGGNGGAGGNGGRGGNGGEGGYAISGAYSIAESLLKTGEQGVKGRGGDGGNGGDGGANGPSSLASGTHGNGGIGGTGGSPGVGTRGVGISNDSIYTGNNGLDGSYWYAEWIW